MLKKLRVFGTVSFPLRAVFILLSRNVIDKAHNSLGNNMQIDSNTTFPAVNSSINTDLCV